MCSLVAKVAAGSEGVMAGRMRQGRSRVWTVLGWIVIHPCGGPWLVLNYCSSLELLTSYPKSMHDVIESG